MSYYHISLYFVFNFVFFIPLFNLVGFCFQFRKCVFALYDSYVAIYRPELLHSSVLQSNVNLKVKSFFGYP